MVTIALIEQLNYLLAIGGICTVLATLFLIYDIRGSRILANQIAKYGMQVALLITLFASVMTLLYSEVFGVIPCGLCWFERVMLYPQVLIVLVALYVKDALMPRYGITLSIVGACISLYHHFIQMGGSQFIKCPTAGAGADCAKRFFFEFGFMTFPLLSAFLFIFLIVLYTYLLKVRTY